MFWKGKEEKKWNWYKHTKPCFSILNGQICANSNNCNYAHTAEEYIAAIKKRNFQIDESIIRQFENLQNDFRPPNKKARSN